MTNPTIAQLFDLRGKGAIVTGGATGIGAAIAARLAEAGAGVTIVDIDLDTAKKTTERIIAGGAKAQAVQANVASRADVEKAVQATADVYGGVHILVNNAGIFPASAALEVTEEVWDRIMNVNLKGPYLFAQTAARQMIREGHGGKIVNIASLGALFPTGYLAGYEASKGGVVSLTRSLALELAPHRILVNAVAPGGTASGTRAAAPSRMGPLRTPLGRGGEPDDIARAVLFLASPASDYIIGTLITVDGGQGLAMTR